MIFYGFLLLLPLFAILFLVWLFMTKKSDKPGMHNQPRTEYPQKGRAHGREV